MKAGNLLFRVLMVFTLISSTPVLDRVLSLAFSSANDARFETLSRILGVMPVSAAGIVVNSAADNEINDSVCTLREAIKAANDDSAYNGCPAGSSADIITFAGNYTITLDGTRLPTITSPITITGNGTANTIIQASTCNPVTLLGECTPANDGVFEVDTSGNLTLVGLTVRHGWGSSGSGIFNRGTLTLQDCSLSGNKAINYGGALLNTANSTTSVNQSTFVGNAAGYGGGIYNGEGSTLVVNNSTIATNSSFGGGGIYNYAANLTVTNSTLFANSALDGGGISNYDGSVTVINTTLSENSAYDGGGISSAGGSISITNSTLFGNAGGGIYSGTGTTFLYINTMIAQSTNGADCTSAGSLHSDSTHNLVEDGSCFVATNLDGDPKLGPLADNGGPTRTHALLPGSQAIDSGSNAFCPNTDQRGFYRPFDGDNNGIAVCDIGAFELHLVFAYLPLIIR